MRQMTEQIIDMLADFATELLIINSNIDDTDDIDKQELKLKKRYASIISKLKKQK